MAAVNAMLQSSSGVDCHNQRTFCMADYSKCKSAQRERINWRNDCRANYDRAFNACISKLPGLRGHNGIVPPKVRENYYNQRCGHTRNGSGRCEIEITSCPATNYCNQQYGQCVRSMNAPAPYEEPELAPPSRYRAPEPSPDTTRPVSPPAQPDTRYRVYVKNGCRKYIEIAYFYEESPGQWAKSGWRGFQPGRVGELKSPIMTRRLGLFSSLGFPEQRYRRGFNEKKSVIDRDFLVPINEQLRGKGARTVPFDMLEWASDISKPVIVIENCDQYEAGARIKRAQKSNAAEEPKPVLLRVTPSPEPEPAQPRMMAVEEPPASAREPIQPAACQKIDRTAMSPEAIDRYESLAARGFIKLCEVD